jgi:hypothetical protein
MRPVRTHGHFYVPLLYPTTFQRFDAEGETVFKGTCHRSVYLYFPEILAKDRFGLRHIFRRSRRKIAQLIVLPQGFPLVFTWLMKGLYFDFFYRLVMFEMPAEAMQVFGLVGPARQQVFEWEIWQRRLFLTRL